MRGVCFRHDRGGLDKSGEVVVGERGICDTITVVAGNTVVIVVRVAEVVVLRNEVGVSSTGSSGL